MLETFPAGPWCCQCDPALPWCSWTVRFTRDRVSFVVELPLDVRLYHGHTLPSCSAAQMILITFYMIFKVWSRDIPLLTVSVRVSVTVVNTTTKSNLEGSFSHLTAYSPPSRGVTTPRQGLKAEAMEECCRWLAPRASLLSYTPHGQGWHILQQTGPSHINH